MIAAGEGSAADDGSRTVANKLDESGEECTDGEHALVGGCVAGEATRKLAIHHLLHRRNSIADEGRNNLTSKQGLLIDALDVSWLTGKRFCG
ncbi:hypothetical protein GUJ93_ZPchr0008g13604 [Zizania palustris]|uniref:Uncharacterized protein n=1 Tax=Zizania palustris TaxID=103762 RepID=A0A8J5V279_ZIZPA|nr:hypothetical protein GUJ93_ZPchr0008g13604 [Zizania palustris]